MLVRVLSARFLNSSAQVKDTFQIVEGAACRSVPATGCGSAPKGEPKIKNHTTDAAKDKWLWKWRRGRRLRAAPVRVVA